MIYRTRSVGHAAHSAPYRFICTGAPRFATACALLFLLTACTQPSTAPDTVTWVKIPGAGKDIGAGGGKVWVVGVWPDAPFGDQIFRWTGEAGGTGGTGGTEGNPWTPMPQGGTRITVDDRGHGWAIDALHNIYRFSHDSFERIPGKANDIAAGGGQVWVIGVDPKPPFGDNVYRWTGDTVGNPWEPMAGAGTRIAVDHHGNAWLVNAQHDIFHFDGTAFEQIPGQARDIGAGGGKVWVIGVIPHPPYGGMVFRWTGGKTGDPWEWMPGAGKQIAVDQHGNPWLVNAQNEVFRGAVAALEATSDQPNSQVISGGLPAPLVRELTEKALAIQGDLHQPWNGEWGNWIEFARGQGAVSDADYKRYAEQSASKWKFRATRAMDDHTGRFGLSFDLSHVGGRVASVYSPHGLGIKHRIVGFTLDGIPMVKMGGNGGSWSFTAVTGHGSGWFRSANEIPGMENLKSGKYQATLILEEQIYESTRPDLILKSSRVELKDDLEYFQNLYFPEKGR